jgi:uncharacterized protein
VPILEIDTDELADPLYRSNSPDRCYFCKRELWTKLVALGRERGFATVIDGTHVEDLGEHRPGFRAGAELGIRSPLAELGWNKSRIRGWARSLEIEAWNAPSAPCLSSRIRYGLEVTPDRLLQVERAEGYLRALGVTGDLRVRHHGVLARIEADGAGRALVERSWAEVEVAFGRFGFQRVECDPRGYRRGSLLPVVS